MNKNVYIQLIPGFELYASIYGSCEFMFVTTWISEEQSKCHERFRFNLLEEAFTIFGLSASMTREVKWGFLDKKHATIRDVGATST